MAVNLSPVGGVAAQFFDNSGQVLTGGKLYSYLAGTTTPAVTYTSSNGITAHSNPIVLNAAGRVPDSGEIWLTDSVLYKFVLKDSNDVQIATWDNIDGINSNFVAYSVQNETATATQGQTAFTLTSIQYTPATNSLAVYVNGSKQILTLNYVETSSTVVTFIDGLNVGDVVQFTTAVSTATNVIDASNVSYNEGAAGAVDRNVQEKLQESISVKDFGAVGDGTTDDTTAIQDAINSLTDNQALYFPAANYLISSALTIPAVLMTNPNFNKGVVIKGDGFNSTVISSNTNHRFFDLTYSPTVGQLQIEGISFISNSTTNNNWHIYAKGITNVQLRNCAFWSVNSTLVQDAGVYFTPDTGSVSWEHLIDNCRFTGSSIRMDGCSDSAIINSYVYAIQPDGVTNGRNYGIKLSNCGNIRILNNHIGPAPDGGINMIGPGNILHNVSNNFFDTSSNTAYLHGVYGSPTWCTFVANNFGGLPGSAFKLVDAFECTFTNNTFYNCGTQGYNNVDLLSSTTGSFGNRFADNNFIGTGTLGTIYAINEQSTAPISYRNTYDRCVYRGSGTWFYAFPISFGSSTNGSLVTNMPDSMQSLANNTVVVNVGTTSTVVSHGLSQTPTFVQLSNSGGWGAASTAWVSNITSTQFTVNVNTAPSGASLVFFWRAGFREA